MGLLNGLHDSCSWNSERNLEYYPQSKNHAIHRDIYPEREGTLFRETFEKISYMSNISTFTLQINKSERNELVLNGYNVAIMGNSTQWSICIGCAIISRSL
jgi:hypothetical protein